MSLKEYSQEQLKQMSLVELAYEIFRDSKKPVTFSELIDEIVRLQGIQKSDLDDRLAQFYTDLNIDGRFISLGDQRWGLRSWYPVDQIEEEVQPVVKTKAKKKKTKAAVVEEDFDDIEEEEIEDLEEDLELVEDDDVLDLDDEEIDEDLEDFDEDDDEDDDGLTEIDEGDLADDEEEK
ncbi:DNA-directed RNA polymerase subunit delta [Bacillus xiamenensis]|uniref:Probable DNA-directed RNA polymerase subunit delta n=1 Tax=Bacillus xiamenensis TaxID=1178537 RepID=A0AAC9IG37_9BACI|nr:MULTISPECIES: DNA-directed RNA polymerase subunit delta [Bacillus]AOZ89000.1 DNA-directed RNA polymerase subunit delta [Bacillus xiamenensis]EKF37302.1 DNA-directed RNA polymerase subunit delta [Bacillus xiamenensis]MBG9910297.1 DNA-directed RNA polymerase subunit delta [Bacillus xiamenensis]MCW1834936.1 DNA-directed RNA polymerase subunit delta [Bacillus xiamenensis]MCY9575068.1 DNA-directed RNA polymerase subunit delta [Bacillus xiamenensis]